MANPATPVIQRPGNREAIALWYTVILHQVRENLPDLTGRQLAVLLTVYIDPRPFTIKMLSERLKVSKPAICRAVDALEKMKYVQRQIDQKDKRVVTLNRTSHGYTYLGQFSEQVLSNLAAIQ